MIKRTTAVLAALLIGLTACGADSPSAGGDDDLPPPAQGGDGELTEVSIGMLPILPTAALYAGIDAGIFEDAGLQVTIETGQGGAALVPGVMSGQLQFATSNPVSLLQAREQGLDVRVVTHYASGSSTGDTDVNGVIALDGSGIDTAADLAGRTVAVNTLNGMGGLSIREAVRQDGGDPDAVQFVELPFPDMPAALQGGDVDAVWDPEPFLTTLTSDGAHVVTFPGAVMAQGHPTLLLFTSGELADSDPDLVASVRDAMNASLELAESDPDAVRAAVPQFLPQLDPALLEQVALEEFGTDLRRPQLERIGELMVEDGLLQEPADVDGLLSATG